MVSAGWRRVEARRKTKGWQKAKAGEAHTCRRWRTGVIQGGGSSQASGRAGWNFQISVAMPAVSTMCTRARRAARVGEPVVRGRGGELPREMLERTAACAPPTSDEAGRGEGCPSPSPGGGGAALPPLAAGSDVRLGAEVRPSPHASMTPPCLAGAGWLLCSEPADGMRL